MGLDLQNCYRFRMFLQFLDNLVLDDKDERSNNVIDDSVLNDAKSVMCLVLWLPVNDRNGSSIHSI